MIITAKDANRRLDKFLFQYLNAAPHSFVYKMLRKKRIKLNGNRAQGSEILAVGDELKFYISPETIDSFRKARIIEKAKPLTDIVFEDEHFLVVNKPVGLPSHGGMDGKTDHLLARLLYYLYNSGAYAADATFVPAICNRLDVNTSGLVVCGKNLNALQEMNALFADKGIKKEYIAVVDGVLGDVGSGKVLEGFYEKDTKNNIAKINANQFLPSPGSMNETIATTEYKILAISRNKRYTLVQVNPITGRSHQIRAHFAAIGHPLAGDKKYGGSSKTPFAPAQLLHCKKLTIVQSGITWEADVPKDMATCSREWFR